MLENQSTIITISGSLEKWPNLVFCPNRLREALQNKKKRTFGEFQHLRGGGIFLNPKSFVYLPSNFWYTQTWKILGENWQKQEVLGFFLLFDGSPLRYACLRCPLVLGPFSLLLGLVCSVQLF